MDIADCRFSLTTSQVPQGHASADIKQVRVLHNALTVYRALDITSRKHVTKYCAQWQLKGSRCLTHDLCAIFTGFTQRDNCAIAKVNIIKT